MRNLLVYLLLTFASTLVASEINWAKDFKAGIKEASRFNKPVLFISSRHTCRYCVILDNTTLKNKKVIDSLNKDFTSIISYSDENDYMPKELYQPGTPAIWFLLPSGEPMYQPIMGAIGAKDFLEALSTVKKEFDDSKKIGK
ncbi:thioredoxin family protein [Sulfurimonas sp.]|uniref:thioredoxin family protein n=1 Tax=Sulfurimonas sp. TaxID=2022749 RepID=UPI002AB156AF|nr:DUF255 domain-containing protein [Sulfurimonas sp.]